MNLTEEQIKEYAEASELHINLPEKYLTDKNLFKRYHLERGNYPEDGDENGELFYNQDLRSLCGLFGEVWHQPFDLIIWPQYYAEGWEGTYFARLLMDATEIKTSEQTVQIA